MKTESETTSSGLKRLLHDPFLHFILLGLLIFVVAAWRDAAKDSESLTIRVDDGLKAYLVNLYNVQFGTYPDAATTELLIDNHIRDEVLFREALRLGLAQQDEIIRRRLVQKMEYLLLDNEVVAEPSEQVLEDFMQANASEFILPGRADFEHIYFMDSTEASGEERAVALLGIQAENGNVLNFQDGDRFPLNSVYTGLSPREVSQIFGQSEFAAAVFTTEPGEWSGPWRSGYGWHLLKVDARQEGGLPPLEQVRDQVSELWMDEQKEALFRETMDQLVTAYTVERLDSPASMSVEQ